jgi:hypothetical protein
MGISAYFLRNCGPACIAVGLKPLSLLTKFEQAQRRTAAFKVFRIQ